MTLVSADPNGVSKSLAPGRWREGCSCGIPQGTKEPSVAGRANVPVKQSLARSTGGVGAGERFCPGPMPFGMRRCGQVGRGGGVRELNRVYREALWPLAFSLHWPF